MECSHYGHHQPTNNQTVRSSRSLQQCRILPICASKYITFNAWRSQYIVKNRCKGYSRHNVAVLPDNKRNQLRWKEPARYYTGTIKYLEQRYLQSLGI